MAENNDNLDSFLTTGTPATPETAAEKQEDASLEDEFAKLLSSFINQDEPSNASNQSSSPAPQSSQAMEGGLDGFVSTQESLPATEDGLDGFVSPKQDNASENASLDSLVETSGKETSSESSGLESFIDVNPQDENTLSSLDTLITAPEEETENDDNLKPEEQELARAISNFQDGIIAMSNKKNLSMPKTDYEESMLKPNYKPSVGKKIAQYLLECWDLINKYDPEDMKLLPADAGDEEYLSFAEGLNDTYMQLAIISYVEILINMEACEISYEQKKEALMKNKIKRELYEEYMELQERKNMFIQKLKEKNFPIDVDRLINNYFRAAQKDPDGAFEALTKNPAMFAPIEFEKMHSKFFGLIKVTPEDGIKANQKIGTYVKKLKV